MIFFYFCLFLTFCLVFIKRDLFNPACITCIVWCTLIFLYQTIDTGLNKLSPLFFKLVFFWCLSFTIGCLLVSNLKFTSKYSKIKFQNINLIGLYWCLLFLLLLSFILIFINADKIDISPIGYVRNIGLNSPTIPYDVKIINFVTTIIYPVVFLFLETKAPTIKKFVIFILYLFLSVLSGSKSQVMQIALTSIFLLFYRKRFNYLLFLVVALFLILAVVVITLYRDNGNSKIDFLELIYIYFFSPLPAFDLLINNEIVAQNTPWGSTVFGVLFRICSKLFGTDIPSPGLGFVEVPVPTNVYTVMLTGYVDFGIIGMFFFSFFYGMLWGWFYSFVKRENTFYKLLYACFFHVLVLQFFADYFFPYLMIYIYQVLILILIYSKSYNIFLRESK